MMNPDATHEVTLTSEEVTAKKGDATVLKAKGNDLFKTEDLDILNNVELFQHDLMLSKNDKNI